MSRLFPLEDFGSAIPKPGTTQQGPGPEIDVDAVKLESYETGYQCGWDDALQQMRSDKDKLSEEFARNIRDLSFTFQEAKSHVISTLEPLIEALIGAFFPTMAAEAIAAHAVAVVHQHADRAVSKPLRIQVSPADADMLRSIIGEYPAMPIEVSEEAAMAVGQARFLLGKTESILDLSDVAEAARHALLALKDVSDRTLRHG